MTPNPNDPTTSGPHPVGSNFPPNWIDPDNKRSEIMEEESTHLDEEKKRNEEEKEKESQPEDFQSFDVNKVKDLEKAKKESSSKEEK